MKKVIVLFVLAFIALSSAFAQDRTPGGPIGGADMKVGRHPPRVEIATTTSNDDGTFEFPVQGVGKGYFIEIAIKEKGKAKTMTIAIDDIEIKKTATTYKTKIEHSGDPHEYLDGKHTKDWTGKYSVNANSEANIVLTISSEGQKIVGKITIIIAPTTNKKGEKSEPAN